MSVTRELIQLAINSIKKADAGGKHRDEPEKPKNLRPSQGAAARCGTCKHFQGSMLENTCTKYKYPVEPFQVCDSYEPQDFTPPDEVPPAMGDSSPFVSSVANNPGVIPVPKMAAVKQAVSAKLVARTLASGLQRNVDPARIQKFTNRIGSWARAPLNPTKGPLNIGYSHTPTPMPGSFLKGIKLIDNPSKEMMPGGPPHLAPSHGFSTTQSQLGAMNEAMGTNVPQWKIQSNKPFEGGHRLNQSSLMTDENLKPQQVVSNNDIQVAAHEFGHARDMESGNAMRRSPLIHGEDRAMYLAEQMANRQARSRVGQLKQLFGTSSPTLPIMFHNAKKQQDHYARGILGDYVGRNTNLHNREVVHENAANMGAYPGFMRPIIKQMNTIKQSVDMLQLQNPGQFASGTIAPPGGSGPSSNAASGITPPPAQPLTPSNEGAMQQQQQQQAPPQQPQQQQGAPQQSTSGQPIPGGYKPSVVLGNDPNSPQLSGMLPFVPADPNVQQMGAKQASFKTLIKLAQSRIRQIRGK